MLIKVNNNNIVKVNSEISKRAVNWAVCRFQGFLKHELQVEAQNKTKRNSVIFIDFINWLLIKFLACTKYSISYRDQIKFTLMMMNFYVSKVTEERKKCRCAQVLSFFFLLFHPSRFVQHLCGFYFKGKWRFRRRMGIWMKTINLRMPKQIFYLRALNRNIENYANHGNASFCENGFCV